MLRLRLRTEMKDGCWGAGEGKDTLKHVELDGQQAASCERRTRKRRKLGLETIDLRVRYA